MVLVVSLAAFGACKAEEELPPVKIGLIRGFTGPLAASGEKLAMAVKFALDEVGWEVGGRAIVLLQEDEGADPETAVAKARKLVTQDKVDVIIGPTFLHSSMAVTEYLAPLGVPRMSYGAFREIESEDTFFCRGPMNGMTYSGGLWCYDELGARTAALLYTDYEFGYVLADGFKKGFTEKGGTITNEVAIPFGTVDMSPYIVAMGEPDVIAGYLVTPTDFAFVKQYHEFGLKMPMFWLVNFFFTEPVLQELGDLGLGMYGTTHYTPEIDTDFNNAFVKKFKDNYGEYPMTNEGYVATLAYLEALKATGGDPDFEKITQALIELKDIRYPGGSLTFGPSRVSLHPAYIVKVVMKDRLCWDVVKKYPWMLPE